MYGRPLPALVLTIAPEQTYIPVWEPGDAGSAMKSNCTTALASSAYSGRHVTSILQLAAAPFGPAVGVASANWCVTASTLNGNAVGEPPAGAMYETTTLSLSTLADQNSPVPKMPLPVYGPAAAWPAES
jgi:hypothetical protein